MIYGERALAQPPAAGLPARGCGLTALAAGVWPVLLLLLLLRPSLSVLLLWDDHLERLPSISIANTSDLLTAVEGGSSIGPPESRAVRDGRLSGRANLSRHL